MHMCVCVCMFEYINATYTTYIFMICIYNKICINTSNYRIAPCDSTYIVPEGHQVAARISKPKDVEETWILASVIHFHTDKTRYEVEDIMEEEGKK